ncbi:MAG: AraC family transcriptional regulator [Ignavibacteriaceae bacterium]
MKITNNKYFAYISEKDQPERPTAPNGNIVFLSELRNACFPNVINNYSIKFTLHGVENYKINKAEFKVPEMYFLTASGPCDSVAFMESKSLVRGLCIDISLNLIDEALTILSAEKNIDLENNLSGYFRSEKFFENVYPISASELGKKLLSITEKFKLSDQDLSFINEEFFLELSESVIRHEFENLRKLNSLSSIKISTKKEILKRLLQGKNFIDDNFKEKIDVKEIARISCLSEFHFFRSFREAFGISPHNYLIKRRLNEAQKLLQKNDSSIGETAFVCGFADIHSFSKSYKKHFGYSPSLFVKN